MSGESMDLLVWGSGGFAREVAWLSTLCNSGARRVQARAFVDDAPARRGHVQNGLPVLAADDALRQHRDAEVVVALGNPQARARVVRELEGSGMRFATLVHPDAIASPFVEIGGGSVVFPGCTLTTNIRIGEHVQLNPGCSVGHDSSIGDCSTLFPGARVSGWVQVGARCLLGAGSVVSNGNWDAPLRIADDCVVGASACVLRSVDHASTLVGVPARPLGGERGEPSER